MVCMSHYRESLLAFINTSTSPFHVVLKSEAMLHDAGFEELPWDGKWYIKEGGAYYVNIFGSTLMAFRVGKQLRNHLRIASAHTDFPTIRIKPNPSMKKESYLSLNVEMYGGLIQQSWLDRPLSIAGKVVVRTEEPFAPRTVLVDFKEPLLVIPSLAIHMNREVNEGVKLNRQTHMLPLASDDSKELSQSLEEQLKHADFESLLANKIGASKDEILFYELGVYPVEAGMAVGFYDEFINAPRLDNLTSVKACLEGILGDESEEGLHMIALFDNEEVGSRTKQGAAGNLLPQVLQRIYLAMGLSLEDVFEDQSRGFMLSADVAHAYHPNYGETCDPTNKPVLNGGVVIKYASSQSYAGDAESVAVVKSLCAKHNIPCQVFVNRSDIVGGSTLGSISSAQLPMRTMDIGVPLLAMHSCRETMGAKDQESIERLMIAFFNEV